MPGAHIQFQFWFGCFVPLLIEMVGLPSILTFWIYGFFYPLTSIKDGVFFRADNLPIEDSRPQHVFMLVLLCWLITVGPAHSDGMPNIKNKTE